MNSKNTINSWKHALKAKLLNESFYNLSFNSNVLPLVNDNSQELFNKLFNGETLIFGELEGVSFINKAMNDYLQKNEIQNVIFSTKNHIEQALILDNIIQKNNDSISKNSYSITYMSFGILNYVIDNKKYRAPLVLIPVRIIKSNKDNHYRITRANQEIYLNTPLTSLLKKEKKIDIAYPINKEFNLSEYIYYLSVKVKPINWSVNDENNLSCFDFSYHYDLEYINQNENSISQNQLVKKIAYLNSEFFSFNQKESINLDNKYLSLLDMDNEEYQLLKTIANRENLLIRCDQQSNKYHFITNIILAYLLNNKRILIAYSNNEEKQELFKEIRNNAIDKFILDLSVSNINKSDVLASLTSYDKFFIPYNSLHPIAIDEDVSKYYDLKNKFHSLVNSVRTTRNPLKTSINKIINNYYALDEYPLLDVSFKSTKKINLEILQQYLQLVNEFASSIESLGCPIEEHPFYGFNKKEMRKEDYIPLKNNVISLSQSLHDAVNIINYGVQHYHLPNATNLKEMKAILNILSFIAYYREYPVNWLNNDNLLETYTFIEKTYNDKRANIEKINTLCASYNMELANINFEIIDKAIKAKNQNKEFKRIKQKYIKNHLSSQEISYLFTSLHALFVERIQIENKMKEIDESYHKYLLDHSLDELNNVFKEIKSYRNNLNYLPNSHEFDINYILENTKIEASRHRQAMQLVFNAILESSKIVQEYFDSSKFDYETISFSNYIDKVSKMSLGFSSINSYIDYYIALHKINHSINKLGNKLIKNGDYKNFENLFLKRFYYDLLNSYLSNKDTKANLKRENLLNILDNFKDSDNNRRKLIDKIIYNNFNKNTRTSLSEIKTTEGKEIRKILENPDNFINLESICERFPSSIHNFKPCILSSYKNVSYLLKNEIYKFDAVLILSDRSLEVKDILPCLNKAPQTLIVDQQPLSDDIRSSIISTDNPANLITAGKNTFNEVKYSNRSHNIYQSMQTNLYDLDFKNYLAKRLKSYGFDVKINRPINEQVVDILVRVKNAPSSTAIMVDRFPYSSPEEASETFYYQDQFLRENGYSPYRIFTSLYFIDEVKELDKLIDYIVEQSKLIPQVSIKKNTILLMDYLFPLFKDPRQVYYNLSSIPKLKDKLSSFLEECCPISIEEIKVVFKENIEEELNELMVNGFIEIKDKFIYIPNKKIRFRRIDREKEFYRPLDSISQQEIFDAVYEIVNYKSSLNKDTIVKMILLSLGYKKANKEKYNFIEEKINYLLEQKIIFIEKDILYKNIEE